MSLKREFFKKIYKKPLTTFVKHDVKASQERQCKSEIDGMGTGTVRHKMIKPKLHSYKQFIIQQLSLQVIVVV